MAGQESRDAVLILSGPGGRRLLEVDSMTAASAPPWPAEEIHWVAESAGEIRIELKLGSPSREPCGLRLAGHRPAAESDRRRARAEAELARGHALRRTYEAERCRAGVAPYESAQRRFAELGLPRRQAEALSGLGMLQRKCLRDDAAALQTFLRAEPLFAGDPAFEALVRQHRGEIRSDLHDYGGAAGECRRALELNRRLGERVRESQTANTLGYVLHRLGSYDQAAAAFDHALSLWRPEDDPGDRTRILLNRGQLYRDLGEAEKARERFQEALDLSRRAGDRDHEATALNALGAAALDMGRPGAALEPLRGALALRSPGTRGRAVTLTSLGVAFRQLGRMEDARRAYAEALPIFHRLGDAREEARCLANLGRLEASAGQGPAALAHLDRALALFRTSPDPPQRALALEGKAWVLRRRGDLEAARALMEEALVAVERHRFSQASYTTRAEFFATQQGFYDFLTGLLMEMHRREPAAGHAAAALEIHERSLARSLLDGLAASGVDLPREGELIEPKPWSAVAIQRGLLDRDTLLLEYRLGDERSFLWAVTSDSLESFELPGRAEIEPRVRQTVGLLARSYGKAAGSAGLRLAELSRLLLGPVAARLQGRRLLVVSDGALQSLPFAALPDPAGGEPLAARHEILSLPSVSVLGALRRETAGRTPAPKTLWVLADPEFGGRFPRLRYTGQEAAAILDLAPGPKTAVQGAASSRAAVLGGSLRDYRFLHFATHGSFTAGDPGGGRLVLAQAGPDGRPEKDGFLHLSDIYGLDLRADLVVLSACRSALGREVRGEGMMGMTRGFFHAGAERVLVSLWNVDDRATVELMRRFYRGMLAEGLAPAAALRQAQNAIRNERRWRAPYYWAGFTLQGEWRPLNRNGPAGKTGGPAS